MSCRVRVQRVCTGSCALVSYLPRGAAAASDPGHMHKTSLCISTYRNALNVIRMINDLLIPSSIAVRAFLIVRSRLEPSRLLPEEGGG